jgi:hypothetical protein
MLDRGVSEVPDFIKALNRHIAGVASVLGVLSVASYRIQYHRDVLHDLSIRSLSPFRREELFAYSEQRGVVNFGCIFHVTVPSGSRSIITPLPIHFRSILIEPCAPC